MHKTAAQKALSLARVTGELLSRVQRDREKSAADAQIITARIPEVVDALVKNERIFGHQKEAVAKGLADHAQCLTLIRDLAAHRTASEVQQIGTPVGGGTQTKTASAGPLGAPVANFDETESGRQFRNALMRGV